MNIKRILKIMLGSWLLKASLLGDSVFSNYLINVLTFANQSPRVILKVHYSVLQFIVHTNVV